MDSRLPHSSPLPDPADSELSPAADPTASRPLVEVERVRTAYERNAKALSLRASVGQGTAVTKVRLHPGLTTEITDGAWTLTGGYPVKSGGDAAGPDPGVFARTALGHCLAVGYALHAANLGLPFTALEVEIHADYDARAIYGVADDVPVGYTQVRYVVRVESDAPEAEILRLLDQADAQSSILGVFSQPQEMRREVVISRPGG